MGRNVSPARSWRPGRLVLVLGSVWEGVSPLAEHRGPDCCLLSPSWRPSPQPGCVAARGVVSYSVVGAWAPSTWVRKGVKSWTWTRKCVKFWEKSWISRILMGLWAVFPLQTPQLVSRSCAHSVQVLDTTGARRGQCRSSSGHHRRRSRRSGDWANSTDLQSARSAHLLAAKLISRSLTRALMGLWIFHHLRGCLNTPPPPRLSRLLRIVEQNGKRRSKAHEKSFRNHFGHFLPQVKIEVSRGQNSKIFQNDFWTIKSLILKVEQRFWYHRVCLVKARRTMFNLTLKGQGPNLTPGQVRARSLGDPSRSNYISFNAPCGDKRNDSNPTSLSHLVLKLLAKKLLVTSSDLHDL